MDLMKLRQPIPANLLRTRPVRNRKTNQTVEIEYVEWHVVADLLDKYAPGWSSSVDEVKQLGQYVVVKVSITIGGVTRSNTGVDLLEDNHSYGDPISNAVAMAFKRAAAMFGVGRDLYQDVPATTIINRLEHERAPLVQAVHEELAKIGRTPEDPAFIKRLIDRFGVDSLEELTVEQLKHILESFKNKHNAA